MSVDSLLPVVRRAWKSAATVIFLAMALAGCSSEPDESWGGEAVDYFDELAAAYSANDYYGVLDFYAVDAFQEKWRGAVRGGLLVREILIWQSGDLAHDMEGIYLGPAGAVSVLRWVRPGGLSAVLASIDDGHITGEVIYDHAAWLEGGLRVDPTIVARYERLYTSEAEQNGYLTLELSQAVNETPLSGPAVFIGPGDFGDDPHRAIGIYEVEDDSGCRHGQAISWRLSDDRIVEKRTFVQPPGDGGCSVDAPPGTWWNGLSPPLPRDEMVTGVLETDGGQEIDVMNGTAELEMAIVDGLTRFSEGGLDEPAFDSVTFEPTRACEERSGRLIQANGSRAIFLCFFTSDLCQGEDNCEEPRLGVRADILHELAHAWLLDHADSATQDRLLAVAGLSEWDTADVPWPERGVEYAAEVLTWGLLDEWAPMVRIGRPTCGALAEAYEALTSVAPTAAFDRCEARS